jgi:hypothetical protein
MAMKRADFRILTEHLDMALDCLDENKIADAKASIEQAVAFLEHQQFHKGPRGVPFAKGEDERRKDRLRNQWEPGDTPDVR